MNKYPKHVLIDGDVLLYSCGFAAESKEYNVTLESGETKLFDDKEVMDEFLRNREGYEIEPQTRPEPIEHCLYTVKKVIDRIVKKAQAETYNVVLSGGTNFRNDVATIKPYKGTRPDRKPYHYNNIKDYILDNHHAVVTDNEEADDYLSYKAYVCDYTIATIDKDLRNTPGWHYNWNKDDIPVQVSDVEAARNFWTQMLTGDNTDNIPSLFQVTGQRATAAIKTGVQESEDEVAMARYVYETWMEAVANNEDALFHELGMTLDEVLTEIGRLLWMRRTPDEMWEFTLND